MFDKLVFLLLVGFCLAQNRPFPQKLTYTNCIKPAIAQTTLNNDVKNYYNSWKASFLKQSTVDASRYYIKAVSTGGVASAITNSEAMGYGMIITVLMAGYDVDAKKYFDGLYKMFDTHRSANNKKLMQWQVLKTEVRNNDGSATDGDMDIAYALLLAHYQWGSSTDQTYLTRAKDMINNGLKVSYIMSSNRLALSDDPTTDKYSTRTSDWMFSHLQAYKKHTGDTAWDTLSANLYTIFNKVVSENAAATGLISDFVMYADAKPAPPYKPQADEGKNTGNYYYNAGRVPLRVVMDYCHYGNTKAKAIVEKMVKWIKTKTVSDPAKIKAGYDLAGVAIGNYPTALFISPLVAASVTNTAHEAFLTNGWNTVKVMKEGYFEDTYNLLCMLFISGNWWIPA